jgi:hypothetical protein
MRTRNKVLLGCLAALIVLISGWRIWLWYEYPYGRTHRCSRALLLSLIQYAGDHDDKLPTGGATPEASLCVLYKEGYVDADALAGRGMSAESLKVARKILESGGVLGPDTCDWHYVDGIGHDGDASIALFWGKSDLGHVGQRLHGGHEVAFNDGHVQVIPAGRWKEFLGEQEKLVAEYRKQKQGTSAPAPP